MLYGWRREFRQGPAKCDLAVKEWKHAQNYADAKTGVIEEIFAQAARARD